MLRHEGEISVTLLLNGGHSRTLYLRRKDPLLTSLVSSIGEKSYGGGRPARPFNIRLDQGRRSFIFSSTDLVGLITDPPVQGDREQRQPALPASPARAPERAAEKSPYVILDNFVDPALYADLLKFVTTREDEFVPTPGAAGTCAPLLLLQGFHEFAGLFRDRLRSLVPQLALAFGLGDFRAGEIDCHLAAENDGYYVKLHSDTDTPEGRERAISFVYYFHNEPQSYSGGEFRLYNSRLVEDRYEAADPAALIAPRNNSILLFPSHCHHEVLPLRCASNRFVDGRFTVAGWVRRAH